MNTMYNTIIADSFIKIKYKDIHFIKTFKVSIETYAGFNFSKILIWNKFILDRLQLSDSVRQVPIIFLLFVINNQYYLYCSYQYLSKYSLRIYDWNESNVISNFIQDILGN